MRVRKLHAAVLFVLSAVLSTLFAPGAGYGATAKAGAVGDFVFTGDPGLYLVHADGSGLRRVTFRYDSNPAWSPDGRSIAFVRNEHVWVLDLGHGARRITAGFEPTWSPDGARLAYTKVVPNGLLDVFWVSATGGTPHRLTYAATRGCDAREPAWSPLGPIAYRQLPAREACTAAILEKSIGEPHGRLVIADSTARGVAFSLDGQRLFYLAACPADIDCDTVGDTGWEATAAGAQIHLVVGGYECQEAEPCLASIVATPGGWIDARTDRDANDIPRTCFQGGVETAAGVQSTPPEFCVLFRRAYDFSVRAE